MSEKPNLIVDLTFSFSLKIIAFTEVLESKRKFNMASVCADGWKMCECADMQMCE